MKNQQSQTKNEAIFDQIRCKKATKARFSELMAKVKKKEGVRYCSDQMLNFFIDQITSQQIHEIQDKNISPATKEKRLKTLWVKTNKKKITDSEWKGLLYSGALSEFIQQNSRISVNI